MASVPTPSDRARQTIMTATRRLLVLAGLLGCSLMAAAGHAGEAESPAARPELKISRSLSALPAEFEEAGRPDDLWQRLRAGFRMPDAEASLVQVHENWFAARQAYLSRAVQRSRLYLFHIAEEVERRDMPMEIALLPMIESAYNPMALSPQKASGIWQFIPSTGKVFGLQQNAWYDGRRDILAATDAALDYLQILHRMFGDWELALAAYNCGEGCVGRAVARNQARGLPTDYASLELPAETRHYVPKLIAVRNIVAEPERYGLALEAIDNEPYFSRVRLGRPMEARHAAKLADMSLDDFLSLNPAFQRRIIHTDTPGMLLLPADRVETFQDNLQRHGDRHELQSYQASRGESLHRIASQFGVTLEWLKEHNPVKLIKGKLAQGQTLVLPAQAKAAPAAARPAVTAKAGEKKAAVRTHTVRKGDTLDRLAKRYKVKVSEIRQFNQAMAEPLRPGDKIAIPVSNS